MTTWRRSNQICIEGIRSFKILQVLVNFHVLCFLVEAVCPLCRCVLCIFTLHWSTSVVLKGAWLKCWYLVWIECVCMYAVNIQVQITEWKKTLLMLLTASPHHPPHFLCCLRTSPHLISIHSHIVCWHKNHQTAVVWQSCRVTTY